MSKTKKTNALRLLDQKKITYTVHNYDVKDGLIDGVSVANKVGFPMEMVYKTLVTRAGKDFFVFVVPVEYKLNLKKAAMAVGVKKIELIHLKELHPLTGYVHGGCSPIGMKKAFKTTIHKEVENLEEVVFSAGKVGLQVKVAVKDLDILRFGHEDLI